MARIVGKCHRRMVPPTKGEAAEMTGESPANVDNNDGGTTATTESATHREADGRRARTKAAATTGGGACMIA